MVLRNTSSGARRQLTPREYDEARAVLENYQRMLRAVDGARKARDQMMYDLSRRDVQITAIARAFGVDSHRVHHIIKPLTPSRYSPTYWSDDMFDDDQPYELTNRNRLNRDQEEPDQRDEQNYT